MSSSRVLTGDVRYTPEGLCYVILRTVRETAGPDRGTTFVVVALGDRREAGVVHEVPVARYPHAQVATWPRVGKVATSLRPAGGHYYASLWGSLPSRQA